MQSTTQMFSFSTAKPEQTIAIGEIIGLSLHGGEIIELSSDVGGGKTTLTKGIVRGTGCHDTVTSPTFTIAKEYQGDTVRLYHYDFYRLSDPGIVGQELHEVLQDQGSAVVIEWSAIAKPIFSDKLIVRVTLKRDAADENRRTIEISVPNTEAALCARLEEYA